MSYVDVEVSLDRCGKTPEVKVEPESIEITAKDKGIKWKVKDEDAECFGVEIKDKSDEHFEMGKQSGPHKQFKTKIRGNYENTPCDLKGAYTVRIFDGKQVYEKDPDYIIRRRNG